MKLYRIVSCAFLGLGHLAGGPVSVAAEPVVAERWVGFCVRYSTSTKTLSDAVLVLSSGDVALDARMRAEISGMRAFHHTPLGDWVPLRVGPKDQAMKEAEAYNGPPLPEIDCSSMEKARAPAR